MKALPKLHTKLKVPHVKLVLKRFHLNDHTIGFHPQTQKLEPPYENLLGRERVIVKCQGKGFPCKTVFSLILLIWL